MGISKAVVEPYELELVQSLQKRSKPFKDKESTIERKTNMAEKLRKMSVRERCLMVEIAIYAEDELDELSVEYQDMWKYMKEISEAEIQEMNAKRMGSSSRCGGS